MEQCQTQRGLLPGAGSQTSHLGYQSNAVAPQLDRASWAFVQHDLVGHSRGQLPRYAHEVTIAVTSDTHNKADSS